MKFLALIALFLGSLTAAAQADPAGFTGRYRERLCKELKAIEGFRLKKPGEIRIVEQGGRVTFFAEGVTGKRFMESFPLGSSEVETKNYPELGLEQSKAMLASSDVESLTLTKTIESRKTDPAKSTVTVRELKIERAVNGLYSVLYTVRIEKLGGQLKEMAAYRCAYEREYL